MKTNELPLRDRITAHLKEAGEATAAAIAKAVGMTDLPSRVIAELNAMRTDALIEAERKAKVQDVTYWLASATTVAQGALPSNIKPGTRASIIWHALPEYGRHPMSAREVVSITKMTRDAIAPALTDMARKGQAMRHEGKEFSYTRMPDGKAAMTNTAAPEQTELVAELKRKLKAANDLIAIKDELLQKQAAIIAGMMKQ